MFPGDRGKSLSPFPQHLPDMCEHDWIFYKASQYKQACEGPGPVYRTRCIFSVVLGCSWKVLEGGAPAPGAVTELLPPLRARKEYGIGLLELEEICTEFNGVLAAVD